MMESFKELLSPFWWFTALGMALFVNLLSNYVWDKFIDRWLSSRSEKRRKRLEEEKAYYQQRVEDLSRDPTELILQSILATGLILVAIVFFSTGIILTGLASATIQNFSWIFLNRSLVVALGSNFLVFAFMLGRWGRKSGLQCLDAHYLRKEALLEGKKNANEPQNTPAKRDAGHGFSVPV
jgi:MFS family permease